MPGLAGLGGKPGWLGLEGSLCPSGCGCDEDGAPTPTGAAGAGAGLPLGAK